MKTIAKLVLLLVSVCALSVCAFADSVPESSGMYGIAHNDTALQASDVTFTAKNANKDAVSPTTVGSYEGFCANAECLNFTLNTATAGKQYLLVVTNKETTAPQVSDIVYIDQVTATNDGASFLAYPSKLASGEYYLYVSSNAADGIGSGGLQKVGSFHYFKAVALGNVTLDEDDEINVDDALAALSISIHKKKDNEGVAWTSDQLRVADVDKSGSVTAKDALWILEMAVEIRTTFAQ